MKTILNLLRNPLVKILGLCAVFYFGLLANKKDPESLGNRLSKENINRNIDEVKYRGQYIMENIKNVKKVEAGEISADELREKFGQEHRPLFDVQNYNFLKTQDLEKGFGTDELKCNDEAEISYGIYIKDGETQLEFFNKEKLLIGSKKNVLLEQKIIGMKRDSVRIINIPRDLKPFDKKLSLLLKFNETDLFYKVILHDFSHTKSVAKCN